MTMFLSLIRYIAFVIFKLIQFVNFFLSLPYRLQKQKYCPPIKNHILLLSATELTEKIRKRELSSETIIGAYIERIKATNPIVNAVVEDRFEDAIKDARNIDAVLSTTELTNEELAHQFPLLGLPITIKESISVEGMSWTAGKVFPGGRVGKEDADVVKKVKRAGAVILAVTNTPELCASFESVNNITGRTVNPYDTRRTPCGSSGGEGALLGSGSSLLGIGSDLFGSIRLPAHFCGIYGHKPSARSVSVNGHYPCTTDKSKMEDTLSLGPMTRYGDDLRLLLRVIVKDDFNKQLQLEKHVPLNNSIRIYCIDYDDRTILTHPIDQNTKLAIRKFATYMSQKRGCQVSKIQVKELKYLYEFAIIAMLGLEFDDIHADERAYKELLQYLIGQSNATFPALLPAVVQHLIKQLPKSTIPSCNQAFMRAKDKLAKIMGDEGIIVLPCHPTPAYFHNQYTGRLFDFSYTGLFNTFGFPVTNCPVGMSSDGLPIGLQIVASLNNDGLCLSIAEEIEKAFGGWNPPQFSKTV